MRNSAAQKKSKAIDGPRQSYDTQIDAYSHIHDFKGSLLNDSTMQETHDVSMDVLNKYSVKNKNLSLATLNKSILTGKTEKHSDYNS